ncbi:MAG: hypothetical protein ACI8RZ_003152 [Myxococcota bacterium]
MRYTRPAVEQERYQRAKALFEEAADLEVAEVSAYLDRSCGDDALLRELVERLLGWDDTSSDLDVASLGGVAMASAAQSVEQLEAGQIIDGRYMVDSHLGAGGMATVWRVLHLRLDAWYAIKILALPHDFLKARLLQEGQLQGRVQHRNVVAVTDLLDLGGQPALVMEYVEGPTLADFLRAGRPTVVEIEQIVRGLLAGAGAAHEAGLVHRDLKPANVLLATEDGQIIPKIADFGIARLLSPDDPTSPGLTRTGALMGTPSYMSPEQIRDARAIDYRADIWALGCILHEIITGRRALDGADNGEILTAVLTGAIVLPGPGEHDGPDSWVAAVTAALKVSREDRPDSCADLLALWEGTTTLPAPPRPPRWPLWAGGIAAAAGAALLGVQLLSPPPAVVAEREMPTEVAEPVEVAPEPVEERIAPVEEAVAEPVEIAPEPVTTAPPEPVAVPAAAQPVPVVPEPIAVAEPIAEVPTTGRVAVGGGVDEVWLVSGGQRFSLTDVPPGTYELWVRFSSGDEPTVGLTGLIVTAGQTTTVTCNKVFTQCK